MQETIKCPYCGENIPSNVNVCPYCAENVATANSVIQADTNPVPQSVPQPITQPSAQPSLDDAMKNEAGEKGFFEYFLKDNFANLHFEGMTPLRQYWMGCIAWGIANIIFWSCIAALTVISESIIPYFIGYGIYGLISLCAIPVTVRRLHDTGKSGWYYWMILIPIAGPIILLIALAKNGTTSSRKITVNTTDKIIFGLAALAFIANIFLTPKMYETMQDNLTGWISGSSVNDMDDEKELTNLLSDDLQEENSISDDSDDSADPDLYPENEADEITSLQTTHKGVTYIECTISDPDGYTNIREGRSSNSNIVTQINEGEYFFAREISGDWWPVYNDVPGELIGYIHKSRVVIKSTYVAQD